MSLLALLIVSGVSSAQSGVRVVVVNEALNVRVAPAIGAEVIATVPAGFVFDVITARSADSEWLRVDFNGNEGWINLTPVSVLSGDIGALPVADPRTIPYGGFESPRAGQSDAQGGIVARATNGVRVRAGPSQAYPTLANVFARQQVQVFGRTANNQWIQVLYEGTLGWSSSLFFEFLGGSILDLPIDGIVANSPPIAERTFTGFVDTLKLLLARIDLAQPSLDNIRAKWTDSALTGRAACRDYPARPSDYYIPVPLLAQFFNDLDPLQRDFNDAMANLRLAIDLFIEACNQPGTGNPVSQATVIGALGVVNVVDRQFNDLRARLRALIPPEREVGPDECLFIFRNRSEILPVISVGQIVRTRLSFDKRTAGFCFDALAQQNLTLLALVISGNTQPLFAVSPFDNPTNFVATGRVSGDPATLTISPILLVTGGRYLLLIGETNEQFAQGEIAVAIINTPQTAIIPTLVYDPVTDTVTISQATDVIPPAGTGNNVGGPGLQGSAPGVTCPSVTFTCEQLFTCQEAYACLAAGNVSLDPDGNGIPCENLCAP